MATKCPVLKQDSNNCGLSIAEEVCLKQLPDVVEDSGLGDAAVWYGMEPDSYNDFGGELTTVARSPINASRQDLKGTPSDLDATGGFVSDLTHNNMTRQMQGFMFADVREQPTTAPMNGKAAKLSITVAGGCVAVSGMPAFKVGDVLLSSGWPKMANNGVKVVTDATGGAIKFANQVDDVGHNNLSNPPTLKAVGHQFAADDVEFTVVDGMLHMTSSGVLDFTVARFVPGSWVFIDNGAAGNTGYARIGSIPSTGEMVFDLTTFKAVALADQEPRIYFGDVIRNEEDPEKIIRRTYHIERTLGRDEDGPQAEYLEGAVANEFKLNIATADKVNAELNYVACDHTVRTGLEGLKPGTRFGVLGEDAINTSSDVYRMRMYVHDDTTTDPNALFGGITEGSVEVTNNASPNKAVGTLGAFEISVGNFQVKGSVTAFFSSVRAISAIRRNADVGMYYIFASKNAAIIYDLPLVGLGGGRLNVEKDQPITIPLESAGAKSKFGNTLLVQHFNYLPSAAMPK